MADIVKQSTDGVGGYRGRYKILREWGQTMHAAELYDSDFKVYEGNWVAFDVDRQAKALLADPTHPAIYPVLKGSHVMFGATEYSIPSATESGKIVVVMGEHVAETDLFVAAPTIPWTAVGTPIYLVYTSYPADPHRNMLFTTDCPVAPGTYYIVGYLDKPKTSTDTTVQIRVTNKGLTIVVS